MIKMEKRFNSWKRPRIKEGKLIKWNWVVQHKEKLKLGKYTDIGAFTYINAKNGVELAGSRWNIAFEGSDVKFSRVVARLPMEMPFVGNDLGWLGWYFLSAILFMLVTKKFLKIYI